LGRLWAAQRQQLSSRLFSIGHSNHELERFLSLLDRAAVRVLADVRSSPFSQRLPQFNQPELRHTLEVHGLGYVFLGDQLGGRPRDPAMYDGDGRVDYSRVRQSPGFRAGLDSLIGVLQQHTLAMLCAEEDPLDCHRGLMISPELVEHGICPRHLRGDGSIETTEQLEARLLEATGVGGGMRDGLFAASITPQERAEWLADAYKLQARRRGFRLPPGQSLAAIDAFEEFAAE
jgi:hypothetical protein